MPPKINHDRCNLCGGCMFQCGKFVFSLDHINQKMYPKQAKECIDCFVCYLICPQLAINITMTKKHAADLHKSDPSINAEEGN